jgi:penicillin-binding protein 1A
MIEKAQQKLKPSYKKFVITFWVLFTLCFGTVYYIFNGIANDDLMGKLPSFEQLENPSTSLATQLLSSDGKQLGTIFKENRSLAQYSELSHHLIDALVATEDERFFDHSGIDGKSLARAIIKGGKSGGGSTITQQLAKMLFTEQVVKNKVERAKQKLKEWVVAVQLEKQYTKEEIVTMYFNTLDFVNNAAGVKSASNVYFNTQPEDLKIEEAAMFVGMAKNPALFNPMRRPDTTLFRRNVVFSQMLKNEKITKAEYDSLRLLPLGLEFTRASHRSGVATYFREEVRKKLKKIFKTLRKPDGQKYSIYQDGLKIYTSINYDMQKYAENAVKTHLGKELQPAFFKHWKSKSRGLKKYAPFYFEDYTAAEKAKAVEGLIKRGIRTSSRYKKGLGARPALKKVTYSYNRASYKNQRWVNKVKAFDNKRFLVQQELNRLNKDTTNARSILREKDRVRDEIEVFQDSIDSNKKNIKSFKGELSEKRSAYLKLWEPFDRVMMAKFDDKIRMKVFTWDGERDTLMSPRDSVIHHKWYLRSGLLSIDPHTGFIRAWVGGINYKYFQYDHVRATRQVGSTFKPFVYATAIENGVNPCEEYLNEEVTFPAGLYGLEEPWKPKNAGGESNLDGQSLTLKIALANSVNSITARIMKNFGPEAVINVARRCGISTPIDPVPSICLGTPDVSLYDMVSAYCVFVNKGIRIEPQFITRIEDKNGSVIWRPVPETREAMTEENAYRMIELLSGVAAYGPKVGGKATYGTGVRLRSPNRPYANIPYSVKISGKTGTTQMQSDGWFMGMTPDLVTGVWTGCEDRAAHFLSLRLGMGTNMALPIWGYYMNSIYKNPKLKISKGEFIKPESLKNEEFDCSKRKANFQNTSQNVDFDQF